MACRSSLAAPIAALTAGAGVILYLTSPACAAIGRVKNRLSESLSPLGDHFLRPVDPRLRILP